MRSGAEEDFHGAPHQWNPRRTTHQHHFVDLFGSDACVFHTIAARTQRAIHNVLNQTVKKLAGDGALILLFMPGKLKVHTGSKGEGFFGADYILTQGLNGLTGMRDTFAPLRLNVLNRNLYQQVIDVVAAKVGIAVGGEDFKNPLLQLENGDIECAAAQVIHSNHAFFALVEAVRESCSCRFIHQAENFQTGQAPRITSCLPLGVIEVGGHRDDCFRNSGIQSRLGILLQLPQDKRRDLRGGKSLIPERHPNDILAALCNPERKKLEFIADIFDPAPHQPLHRIDTALRVVNQLLAGRVAYDELARFSKRNDAGDKFVTVLTGDNLGLSQVHPRNKAIGGAEVNAYD